jgi:hypothetical protein
MHSSQAPLLQHLGKMLRVQYQPMIGERVPERWIDLINYLNEKERSQPEVKPGRQQSPKRQ